MNWLTADFHLDHKNIIKYCVRPFKTVEEMNRTIITNYNKMVSPDDTVYILGDFALTKKAKWKWFAEQFPGYKILLVGNHDRQFLKREYHSQDIRLFLELGFDEVYSGVILKKPYLLSHVPIGDISHLNIGVDAWGFRPIPFPSTKQSLNLCAHIHERWMIKCEK